MKICKISDDVRDSFPDEWPDWVLASLQALDDIEKVHAEAFLKDADEWVYQMLLDATKTLSPTTSFVPGKQSAAEFLGSLVGHQERLLEGEDAENAMEISLSQGEGNIETILNQLQEKLPPNEYKDIIEKVEKMNAPMAALSDALPRIAEQKIAALKKIIQLASRQSHTEKIDFFQGYSKALDRPLFNEEGEVIHRKSSTNISVMMVMFWRDVEQMESLPRVYQWLKKIFWKPNVINEDQVRKLCNRKGLSLASPGRKKKQDTG